MQILRKLKFGVPKNFFFELGAIPRNNGDFAKSMSRHLFSLGMSGGMVGGWWGDKIKF